MIISSSIMPEDGTIQLVRSCSYIHLLPNWPPSHSGDQVLAMTTAAQSEIPACWHHNYTVSPTTWALGSKLSEMTAKTREKGKLKKKEEDEIRLVQPWHWAKWWKVGREETETKTSGEDWMKKLHRIHWCPKKKKSRQCSGRQKCKRNGQWAGSKNGGW